MPRCLQILCRTRTATRLRSLSTIGASYQYESSRIDGCMCFKTLSFTFVPAHRLASKIIKEQSGGGSAQMTKPQKLGSISEKQSETKAILTLYWGPAALTGRASYAPPQSTLLKQSAAPVEFRMLGRGQPVYNNLTDACSSFTGKAPSPSKGALPVTLLRRSSYSTPYEIVPGNVGGRSAFI